MPRLCSHCDRLTQCIAAKILNTELHSNYEKTEMYSCNKKYLAWGSESHPKTLPQYLHIALTAVATICIVRSKSHRIIQCSLSGPQQEIHARRGMPR
jgi:hypothetical protein